MIKNFSKNYRSALKDFLASGREAALGKAYSLGRQALEDGMGMLDIAAIHHQVLAALLKGADESPDGTRKIIKQTGDFLAECLSPFEMAQRGFRESIDALNSLNARLEDEVEKRTQAVRESEERYRTLTEISPDAITMTDLQGKIILCNLQSALMHGYSNSEAALGGNTSDFVAPEDLLRVREMGERMLREDVIGNVEYTLIRKDGIRIPVEVRATSIRDVEGRPMGFVGVNRDISERKQAQEKLEARARWQAAVAALGQHALSGIDLDVLMNETVNVVTQTIDVEYCELLELLPEENQLILRDGFGWKEGTVGSTMIRADAGSQAGYTLLSAEPVLVENLAEESRFTPPALLIEHNVFAGMTVIIHGNDQPYGILGAHTSRRRRFTPDDVSFLQSIANVLAMAIDNRRLLETESKARQNAEHDNDLRLKTLAMVSHELRTPLTSIKGFASTLLADDVVWDASQQRDFIQTINDEADKLGDLIGQVLDLTKMDAGVFKIFPIRQSPDNLVAAAMLHLQELAGRHILTISIPDTLPDVFADTQRVGQVLVNLVENAAKYSPPETVISISAQVSDDFIRISVADEGPGIQLQEREKVFQPFYRVGDKAILKAKGAGLGLTICLRLIEAQGGHIWVDEHTGPGTMITFTLPLAGVTEI